MDSVKQAVAGLPPAVLLGAAVAAFLFVMAPSIIALAKRSKDRWAIVAVNVAFFYAIEIWLPLVVWALTGSKNTSLLDRLKRGRTEMALAVTLIVATLAAMVWAVWALFV